jgi:hypothetical protein
MFSYHAMKILFRADKAVEVIASKIHAGTEKETRHCIRKPAYTANVYISHSLTY